MRVPLYSQQYQYKNSSNPAYIQSQGNIYRTMSGESSNQDLDTLAGLFRTGADIAYNREKSTQETGEENADNSNNLESEVQLESIPLEDSSKIKINSSINKLQDSFNSWQLNASSLEQSTQKDYSQWLQEESQSLTEGMNALEKANFLQKSEKFFKAQGQVAEKQKALAQAEEFEKNINSSLNSSFTQISLHSDESEIVSAQMENIQDLISQSALKKGLGKDEAQAYFRKSMTNGMLEVANNLVNMDELDKAKSILKKYESSIDKEQLQEFNTRIEIRETALSANLKEEEEKQVYLKEQEEFTKHLTAFSALSKNIGTLDAKKLLAQEYTEKLSSSAQGTANSQLLAYLNEQIAEEENAHSLYSQDLQASLQSLSAFKKRELLTKELTQGNLSVSEYKNLL